LILFGCKKDTTPINSITASSADNAAAGTTQTLDLSPARMMDKMLMNGKQMMHLLQREILIMFLNCQLPHGLPAALLLRKECILISQAYLPYQLMQK
jgi:hypothetical protein